MAVSQLPAAGTALYTMRFLLRTPVYRLPEGDCLMERTDASPPRRRFRGMVKWVGIVAGAVLVLMGLAVAVVVVSEWTYIDRMRHHPADLITNVAWYVPKEKVPGVGSVSLPVAPPERNDDRSCGTGGRGPARGREEFIGVFDRPRRPCRHGTALARPSVPVTGPIPRRWPRPSPRC